MTDISVCPPTEKLRDLLLGRVTPSEVDTLTEHLTRCPVCVKHAQALEGDDKFIRFLRAQAGEPSCRLLDKLTINEPAPGLPAGGSTPPPLPIERTGPWSGGVAAGLRAGSTAPPDYDILGELGRGGMGVVYKARHLKLNRVVALKMILSGGHAGAEELERFQIEARAVARLQHPGIVQIHEVGEHERLPFFALEFVAGGSLAAKLHGDPWPMDRSAAMVEQLARAMHHAHQSGIVHRDLKPGNILLAADGTLKITDFGLAKQMDTEQGPSRTGVIMGTPSYMAPEQAEGRGRDIGPAADVYALGAILYQLLTGRPPFRGLTTLDTLEQVRTQEPVPPSRLQPKTSRDLETICLKCLQKDPARRYDSAHALADDLQRYLADQPILARPVRFPERTWRWCRRNRTLAGLSATLILVLAGLSTWWVSNSYRLETKRQQVNDRRAAALAEAEMGNLDQAIRELSEVKGICKAEAALAILHEEIDRELQQLEASRQVKQQLEERRLERQPQQIEQKIVVAVAQARAGQLDQALNTFAEAAGLCQSDAALVPWLDAITRQQRQVEQYQQFRQLAQKALSTAKHGFGTRQRPDPITQQIEQPLNLYNVLADEHWEKALSASPLTPGQGAEVKSLVAELLLTLALRLALYDTKDKAGKEATQRAVGLLERVEAIQSPTHAVYLLRMLYHRRLGNQEAADQAGDLAVKTRPQSALDFYLLGSYATQIAKDPEGGKAAYHRALALEPNHYGAHLGIYFIARDQKNLQAQDAALTTCLALRPEEADLYFFRGFAFFESKEYARAHQDFSACVNRNPNYAQAYYWRGRTYIVLSAADRPEWAKAEDDLTRALELNKDLSTPYPWRALVRAKRSRYREAVEDAEAAIKLPHSVDTLWTVARAYSVSVGAVTADEEQSNRATLAEQYGARSVALLQEASQLGYFKGSENLKSLRMSQDLDALRKRPDFKKLLAEAEDQAGKTG